MHFVRTAQIDRVYRSLLYSNDQRNIIRLVIIIFQRNNINRSQKEAKPNN